MENIRNQSLVTLKAENLRKTFLQGQTVIEVLRNTDLTVHAAESVAIIGQSGSGKSTLLSILSGLERPDSGKVTLAGHDLTPLNEEKRAEIRAHSVGFVFQNFRLIPYLSALENVMFPLHLLKVKNPLVIASDLLEKLGLSKRLDHRPDQLSGGEMQRVALARALVTRPQLIFADEPSGNLDPKTGAEVMELLFQFAHEHKTSLVLVTHNHGLAHSCNRTLTLDQGQLK